jgi:hypothetical protein
MKRYVISGKRCVVVKKHEGSIIVNIQEDGCDFKVVDMPSKRWARFVSIINQVEESLGQLLVKQHVAYNEHIGGGWYVSVSTGFTCVDIRKFYYHPTLGLKPTKTGIALRIPEWYILKTIITEVQKKYPTLANENLCMLGADHFNHYACTECNPFQFEEQSILSPDLNNKSV